MIDSPCNRSYGEAFHQPNLYEIDGSLDHIFLNDYSKIVLPWKEYPCDQIVDHPNLFLQVVCFDRKRPILHEIHDKRDDGSEKFEYF